MSRAVVRNAVDASALDKLRRDPAAYIRDTHKEPPIFYRRHGGNGIERLFPSLTNGHVVRGNTSSQFPSS